MLLLTWTWRRTDSTERTFLVLQSDVPAGAAGFLHLKSCNDRAGCRDALLLNSNDHTRGSSGSVIWNVLLDYLGWGESSCRDDGFRGEVDMMMFLAGSGVSVLVHSTHVDLRAGFIDQTDVAIYVGRLQHSCSCQSCFCSEGKYWWLYNHKNWVYSPGNPQNLGSDWTTIYLCVCLTKLEPLQCSNDCEIC